MAKTTTARTNNTTRAAKNAGASANKARRNTQAFAPSAGAHPVFAQPQRARGGNKPAPSAPTLAPAGTPPNAGTAAPVLVAAEAPANHVQHPTLRYNWPKASQAAQVLTAAGGKPYNSKASHNTAMYQQVQAALAAAGGQATMQEICKAGPPAHFVGYLLRRGVLVVAPAAK